MVRDAEANAAADEERKSLVEARNEVDNLIFSTEKNLEEHGEKLSDDLKKTINDAIAEAKTAKDSEDLEEVKSKKDALQAAAMKIGEEIYGNSGGDGGDGEKDNAEEAEFEEKKDDDDDDKKDEELKK